MKNIKKTLEGCGYPKWTFDRVMANRKRKKQSTHNLQQTPEKEKMRGNVAVPYVQGLSERIRRTLAKHKINTYFLPQNKIREGLVHPKDTITKWNTCGCIYEIRCLNCEQTYVGETGRSLDTRIKEHKTDVLQHSGGVKTRAQRTSTSSIQHKSAITDHVMQHNHVPNWDAEILGKEQSWQQRKIRESIWIKRKENNMNRDEGSYELSSIYNEMLNAAGAGGAPTNTGALRHQTGGDVTTKL